MAYFKNFIYNPGGENETGNTAPANDDQKNTLPQDSENQDPDNKEHKSVLQKIKDALHDWSNKDEQDQQFDDTRV